MAYIHLIKYLWHFAGPCRWMVFMFTFLHFVSISCFMATPMVFAKILNGLQLYQGKVLIHYTVRWVFIWLGLSISSNIIHRFGRYYEFQVAFQVKQHFLNLYYTTLANLPLAWHVKHHSGDSLNRVSLSQKALHDFATRQFLYIEYAMRVIGSLGFLLYFSWQISLLGLVMGLISIFLLKHFDQRLAKLYHILNEINHRVSARLFDYISNIRTIITLNLQSRTADELNNQIQKIRKPFMQAEVSVNAMKWFILVLLSTLNTIGAVFYFIWQQLYHSQSVAVGNVAAVFQYLLFLQQGFFDIAREYQQLVGWQTDLKSLETIPLQPENKAWQDKKLSSWQRMDITDLKFAYGKKTIIDIAHLNIQAGQKIALIGESGSGKSTLLTILAQLIAIDKGRLSIDSKNTPFCVLKNTTALIPQDAEIFENTILFNLTFGVDVPKQDLDNALQVSRFDEVVAKLAEGLNTDLSEKGVNLSGGQRQRLALARGILAAKDKGILLLDEPTSSLDQKNAGLIYDAFIAAYPEKTLICVLHGMEFLNKFDCVWVMDQGQLKVAN